MPQLDKFTYFTQFFWSCLFLFTFYGVFVFFCPLHLQAKVFSKYYSNLHMQRLVFVLKFCVFFLIFVRGGFLFFHNMSALFYPQTLFGILPSELALLDHYLKQPHQDPEWVEFARHRLQDRSLSPVEYERIVRDLINTELCFSTQDQIASLYQILFYGRTDPKFFIDPQDLDLIIRVHLESKSIEFDHAALCQILESLCVQGGESPFFTEVQSTQANHFEGFIKQKHAARLDMQHRQELKTQWEALSRRTSFLREENDNLKQQIFFLQRERERAQ